MTLLPSGLITDDWSILWKNNSGVKLKKYCWILCFGLWTAGIMMNKTSFILLFLLVLGTCYRPSMSNAKPFEGATGHKRDFASILEGVEGSELDKLKKVISSTFTDGAPTAVDLGGFSCGNHRWFAHWGFEGTIPFNQPGPLNDCLRKLSPEKRIVVENRIREIWITRVKKLQKHAEIATGLPPQQAKGLTGLLYNGHLLGDWTPGNKELRQLVNVNSIEKDITKNLHRLFGNNSGFVREIEKDLAKIVAQDPQKYAEEVLAVLRKHNIGEQLWKVHGRFLAQKGISHNKKAFLNLAAVSSKTGKAIKKIGKTRLLKTLCLKGISVMGKVVGTILRMLSAITLFIVVLLLIFFIFSFYFVFSMIIESGIKSFLAAVIGSVITVGCLYAFFTFGPFIALIGQITSVYTQDDQVSKTEEDAINDTASLTQNKQNTSLQIALENHQAGIDVKDIFIYLLAGYIIILVFFPIGYLIYQKHQVHDLRLYIKFAGDKIEQYRRDLKANQDLNSSLENQLKSRHFLDFGRKRKKRRVESDIERYKDLIEKEVRYRECLGKELAKYDKIQASQLSAIDFNRSTPFSQFLKRLPASITDVLLFAVLPLGLFELIDMNENLGIALTITTYLFSLSILESSSMRSTIGKKAFRLRARGLTSFAHSPKRCQYFIHVLHPTRLMILLHVVSISSQAKPLNLKSNREVSVSYY